MGEINGRVLSEAEALSLELLTLVTRGGPISERGFVAANSHAGSYQTADWLRRWVDEGLVEVKPGAVWSALDGEVDGYQVVTTMTFKRRHAMIVVPGAVGLVVSLAIRAVIPDDSYAATHPWIGGLIAAVVAFFVAALLLTFAGRSS